MKKFVNALGIIFLFILIFGIIGKSLDFDVLDKNDDPNSDDPIVNPGDIIGPGTDTPVVESRIAVPNSGYVNKVYFDTSLSVDEVESIFEIIEYNLNDVIYASLFSSNDESHFVQLIKQDDFVAIVDAISEGIVFSNKINSDMGVDFIGWRSDYTGVIEFNDMTLSTMVDGETSFEIGYQNDKLIDLFYTYPSELIKEEVTTLGTAVPNSGYVEKVYFNTNLSVEEVVSILETIDYNNIGVLANVVLYNGLEENMQLLSITGKNEENPYAISLNDEILIFTSEDMGFGFVGWNPEISFITISSNVVNEYDGLSVGSNNDKLSSLISITPFN